MFRNTSGNTIMRGRPAYFNIVAATMRYQVEQQLAYSSRAELLNNQVHMQW